MLDKICNVDVLYLYNGQIINRLRQNNKNLHDNLHLSVSLCSRVLEYLSDACRTVLQGWVSSGLFQIRAL